MSTKLLSLTYKAKGNPEERFTSLMHLLNEDFLKECFTGLKRDKAVGADGVTVKEYEENLEENLKDLGKRLRNWGYRPKPLRRVYIPKGNGKLRPLGIPSVEDKIVQMALKKILEAMGIGERFFGLLFAGEHDVPPEARKKACRWFHRWLEN